MYLRIVKARSGAEQREYVQLVEGYRRPDGSPSQKVVANLGQQSELAVTNLRAALAATRDGRAFVLPELRPPPDLRIWTNLRYLDVAVALELWESWKLTELLNRLLPKKPSELVSAAPVIAALTVQRCVSPGSKYFAKSWYPTTALPELLGVEPAQFNNSRLHRVLDQLDEVGDRLQEALPARYQQRHGAFGALFVDVTDTFFEGRGCELAERDRTKEGMFRFKVGIALLCNEKGYPLRWQLLGGKERDPQALRRVVEQVEGLPWLEGVPIVFDRAMGGASAVARLLDSGLRFLTAVRRPEIPGYTNNLPAVGLDVVPGDPDADAGGRMVDAARATVEVEAAGMVRVDSRLHVVDLGVVERVLDFERTEREDTGAARTPDDLEGAAYWLAFARRLRVQLDSGEFANQAAMADALGLTRARVTQILNLLKLDPLVQEELLAGVFGVITDRKMREVVQLKTGAQQRKALEEQAVVAKPTVAAPEAHRPRRTGRRPTRLRLVAYFNAEMLVEQRATAAAHVKEVRAFVAELNEILTVSSRPPSAEDVRVDVVNKLAQRHLLSVFGVQIRTNPGTKRLLIELTFDEIEWKRRRRYDGFVLLVAHPDLPHSGPDLIRLYHAKDAVEKDFQTIKGAVELRPIHHHTDGKVRAHVTLCMLALLLQRTLEGRLQQSAHPASAPAAFEALSHDHLNVVRHAADAPPTYLLTEPTQEQHAILRSLRMLHLIDREAIAERLHAIPGR